MKDVMISITKLNPESQIELAKTHYYNLAKRRLNLKQERILAESNRMEVIITLSENKNASKKKYQLILQQAK